MRSRHPGLILALSGALALLAAGLCSGVLPVRAVSRIGAAFAAASLFAACGVAGWQRRKPSNRLKTLYDGASAMSSMRSQDDVLNYLASTAAKTTRSQVAGILLADRQKSMLQGITGFGVEPDKLAELSIPVGMDDFCGRVALFGRELETTDTRELSAQAADVFAHQPIRTVMGIPIVSDAEVYGVLLLATRAGRYRRSVAPFVRALSDIAAVNLERVRLLFELDQELHELKWLARIADKIHLEEGPNEVIRAVLDASVEVLDADTVALYLLNETGEELACVASRGLPAGKVALRSHRQQAALMDVLEWSEPLVILDVEGLPLEDPLREAFQKTGVRSVLALQLRHKDRPVGLLAAMYNQTHTAGVRRFELCRMLALDAAVALNYSRLLEKSTNLVHDLETANERLEQQAVQDGLTDLANHRFFHQRMSEHVHRVGRYGESFSLAMLDVDHFKAYNDAYGHQEGDLALQAIARIIREEVRESDFAARYGGEEFAIIFPHTPKSNARIALERIRKAIDTYQFPMGKLTISAGLSECPGDGVGASEVVEKADRALYHAKLTGRNRVCIWASSDEQSERDPAVAAPPVSVLVVDIDPESRRAMQMALNRAGYEMHRASSTQEAIELLRSRKFDIMLSDTLILGTEGMSVLGLASAIHPMMPIVMTTAPAMVMMAREAMQHGVTDVLLEPFNEHELPVVIERNLERKRLERQMLVERSTGILLQAIDALVAAIDAKDRLTAGHTARVTHISLAMADILGLPSQERYTLELAARLHDIGKISLPESALNKPGRLTEEDWASMKRHPAVGSQIVGSIEELSFIATIVRHHHERLDGRGYPDGLQGEAIPFLSRIIAVADAYEAMTSERSYRPSMTTEEAVAELRRCIATHYSKEIVDALVDSLNSGALDEHKLSDAA